MGYYVTYNLKEENLNEKYKKSPTYGIAMFSEPKIIKLELLAYCMMDHSDKTIKEIICEINTNVKHLFNVLVKRYREEIYDTIKADGQITFSGWEYAEVDEDAEHEIDTLSEYVIEELILLATVVKTPNYFDESEMFCEKINSINQLLDIEDCIQRNVNKQFMSEHEEYKESTDE